jgi:hypothetical protein
VAAPASLESFGPQAHAQEPHHDPESDENQEQNLGEYQASQPKVSVSSKSKCPFTDIVLPKPSSEKTGEYGVSQEEEEGSHLDGEVRFFHVSFDVSSSLYSGITTSLFNWDLAEINVS